MRFLLTLAAYAALTVSCFAQNGPREITATNNLNLRIGEVRMFETSRDIESFIVTTDEVVKATTVRTDRTFTLRGVGPGEALVTINYLDGSKYFLNVLVGGRTVRLYGTGRDEKDYVSFFCTSTDCGRADTDAPQPTGTTVERQRTDRKGNVITTTKTY